MSAGKQASGVPSKSGSGPEAPRARYDKLKMNCDQLTMMAKQCGLQGDKQSALQHLKNKKALMFQVEKLESEWPELAPAPAFVPPPVKQ